jgi:predicted metal-dependent hydrolase
MSPMEIVVHKSSRRKKTIQGFVKNGRIAIYLPLGLDPLEEKKQIDIISKKLEKKMVDRNGKNLNHLSELFAKFNREFFLGKLSINSIRFVNNQNVISGSCTPADKTIRISERLLDMPPWVLNYVVIHEMAHLLHPDHSKAFWDIVNRYRYTERARGFLMAIGLEKD